MLLDHHTCLIQERLSLLKTADHYDIFDPVTGAQLGTAREQLGRFVKLLRIGLSRHILPTVVLIQESDRTAPVLTLRRGLSLLQSRVTVLDQDDQELGTIVRHRFSVGGRFTLLDPLKQIVAEVRGHWRRADFTIQDPAGQILGTINAPWAGTPHPSFASTDHYVVSLDSGSSSDPARAALLLAAGLAIDIVFKERG